MRPLPETYTTSAPRRPTMRLRDPLTTYKSFETSTASSTQSSNENTLKYTHKSASVCNNNNKKRDSQSVLHLHRTTSLDSLANSSEDPDDNTEDDVCCDDDDLSDVDSISDFGPETGCSSTATTTVQVHRKSDLETMRTDQPPKQPVIKAYLEKTHMKCDYKNCGFKKKDKPSKTENDERKVEVSKRDAEKQKADKLFGRCNDDETTNLHNDGSDEMDVANGSNNNGTMSSVASSSSCNSNGSAKSSVRRLSIASSGSMGRMETILEEPPAIESKISVKEILARFETLNSLEV